MTTSVTKSLSATPTLKLTLRAYTMTLIVCASLYFLRAPEISFYMFDVVWLFGLTLFPKYFLRMPRANYFALLCFATSALASTLYVSIDGRPINVMQATVVVMRFMQMAICANFLYNCVRSGKLSPRDYFVPALIAILIPLFGGLALHTVSPDMTVAFDRYAGYFGNPNSLALYVGISAAVFYGLMRFQLAPRWMANTMVLVFLVAAVYSLALSGSNSGMILFVVVTAVALTASLRGVLLLAGAAGAFFLSLAALQDTIIPWSLDLMTSKFAGSRRTGALLFAVLDGFDLDQLGSYSYREDVKEYLFEQQFHDFRSVLLGLGPGQSKYLSHLADGNFVTIHNFYEMMFLELGILGSLMFAVAAVLTFCRFRWNYQALLLFSGFLLASTGTPNLYLPFYWVPLFAALAGLTQTHFSRNADLP